MPENLSPVELAKYVAAERASRMVEDGMKVGLGTGSTAAWLVKCLGERVRRENLRFTSVPTSTRTANLAREAGIRVVTLEEARWLDLTIDGADEFDPDFTLIKGGGGAHLQEKIVATASDRMVVITDASKRVERLGAFPLPLEVITFGWQVTKVLVEELLSGLGYRDASVTMRMNADAAFVTDEGNRILDLHLGEIHRPRELSMVLNQIPGVVENGLFIDICDTVVVGHQDGSVLVEDAVAPAARGEEPAQDTDDSDNIFRDTSL